MDSKILHITAFLTIIAMSFLSACTECESEPPYVDPKENMWWGYFDGTLDGTRDEDDMSIFVEGSESHPITSSNYTTFKEGNSTERIKLMDTSIFYLDDAELQERAVIWLSISGLYPDTKYITEPDRTLNNSIDNYTYSTVSLRRKYAADSEIVVYIPKEEKPFELQIHDVRWVTPSLSAVEGTLDGTLYRKDAMSQDSIVIKAKFGAGYGMR